ncbi:MAG: LysR family transcriptional regulator [Betaproteobacteria bacterium]|nr:MAG: LysR family transcriptional regulator [Betaproteobacteria bacterium]
MPGPRITLDQWKTLITVVESGGYALAAEQLHKSQSTLSYAIQQIQKLTGVEVFNIEGRKAVLTGAGRALYQRGKHLIEEAERIEQMAAELAQGWESEVKLAVEVTFPTWLLLECFTAFAEEHPQTRVELYESVLGGTSEALLQRRVDLAIGPSIPPGFLGEALMQVHFIPAASPRHPLHQLGRSLTLADLRGYCHLVVRESGARDTREMSFNAEQRWTLSTKATSIRAARMGLGFAWYPAENIREELDTGQLKPLPLRDGGDRYGTLYLMFADPDSARPGAKRLANIIRQAIRNKCPDEAAANTH